MLLPTLRKMLLFSLLPAVAWAQVPATLHVAAGQDKPAQSSQAATQEKKNPPATDKSAATSATDAAPKIDPIKEAHIRELLELTGTKHNMQIVMDGMEKSVRPLMTKALPPGEYREKLVDLFFEKFHSKLKLDDLIDLAVPLYDKDFTDEDLVTMIQFYKTPTGQKVITVVPGLLADLQQKGSDWGRELGRTSMIEVLNEHPELQKALEDAQK